MFYDFKVRRRDDVRDLGAALRLAHPGYQIILASGCFEVLHPGHLRYLLDARRPWEPTKKVFLVGTNVDERIRVLKGEGRPVYPLADRMSLLAALTFVDYVLPFPEDTAAGLIRDLRPDVFARGPDYTLETVLERDLCASLGVEVRIAGHTPQTEAGQAKAENVSKLPPALLRDGD